MSLSGSNRGGILARLRQIVARSKDLAPLAAPVRQALWEANRDRALRGVDWQDRPYAALAAATLRDRARGGYPAGPPLVRRGAEAAVIAGCVVTVDVRDGRLRFTKHFDADWMQYHIEGTSRMPARDPLGWGNELDRVRAMLPAHVLGRPG